MEPQFATHGEDHNGLQALEVLRNLGYQTEVINGQDTVQNGSIVLFTPSTLDFSGTRGKYLRCSAIALRDDLTPEWAQTTPFRVAVLKTTTWKSRNHFRDSVYWMARRYHAWNPGEGQLVPWSDYEKDPSIAPNSSCMIYARAWIDGLNPAVIVRTKRTDYNDPSIRHLSVNAWQVNYTDVPRVFPDAAVEQALSMLSRWQSCFRKEDTWTQRELNTPSIVVRLDCVIEQNRLLVYEVEERPAGMGISSLVNPFFAQRLTQVAKTWPDFDVVLSAKRAGTDDYIWQEKLNRRVGSGLVLVRAEPEETEFHHLEAVSVSTLKAKGDKAYGNNLGLWQPCSRFDDLPWDQGFVLKPEQGSKMRDVVIWDIRRRPGASNRKQIEAALNKHNTMFLQPFHPPMLTGRPEYRWMIYRVFFGYNVRTGQWECLGGNWNARSNLRIHGASDALFGPVVLP